jgi:hypothetical protein
MNSTVHVDLWSWSIWSPGDGVERAYGRAALGRFVQLLMGRSADLVEDLPATHRRCVACHYCDGNPALVLQGVEETRNNSKQGTRRMDSRPFAQSRWSADLFPPKDWATLSTNSILPAFDADRAPTHKALLP